MIGRGREIFSGSAFFGELCENCVGDWHLGINGGYILLTADICSSSTSQRMKRAAFRKRKAKKKPEQGDIPALALNCVGIVWVTVTQTINALSLPLLLRHLGMRW